MMEWYQVNFIRPRKRIWEPYGGRHNPFKVATRDDAETLETEIMKRYPGAVTMIVRVTETLHSNIFTGEILRVTDYCGIL